MTGWLPDGAAEWGGRPVARKVADAVPRCRAVLSGTVVASSVQPEGSIDGRRGATAAGLAFDAVLDDGTGAILVRWVGRASVPGVVPGALLTIEGTVAEVHGRRLILNPLYRFDPAQSSASW